MQHAADAHRSHLGIKGASFLSKSSLQIGPSTEINNHETLGKSLTHSLILDLAK